MGLLFEHTQNLILSRQGGLELVGSNVGIQGFRVWGLEFWCLSFSFLGF